MSSFVSWVDFSSADRERMRKAIALFSEKETRDELGLGTIRDAFADALFPGTSTIHTRLRYMLFVPWIYRELESSRTTAEVVGRRARRRETDLIPVLSSCTDNRGTIGRRSKSDLQRLPSSVYWGALHRWQICLFEGTREQYHRAFDRLRRRRQAGLVPDDEGVESEAVHVWHPRIPSPPDGWPDEVDFDLTQEEADFIRGRIAAACPGTMLDWLARNGVACEANAVWLYPALADVPARLRQRIDLARRFSLVMFGAALVYNLLLAELVDEPARREKLTGEFRSDLGEWAKGDEAADLQTFQLGELWRFLEGEAARVPSSTRIFVERWVNLLRARDPAALADCADARRMVRDREVVLKGGRSRFRNARALAAWGGASGAWRFSYRWGVVKSHLNDLRKADGG